MQEITEDTERIKRDFDKFAARLNDRLTEDEREEVRRKLEMIKSRVRSTVHKGWKHAIRQVKRDPMNVFELGAYTEVANDITSHMGIDMSQVVGEMYLKFQKVAVRGYIAWALGQADAYASKKVASLDEYNRLIANAEETAEDIGYDISRQINKVRGYSGRNAFSRKLVGLLYRKTGILV